MSTSSVTNNQWLNRVLLIAIIAFSAVIIYGVNQIDQIVNDQLYDYQLQPNQAWLDPYHNFAYIIYASLAATMVVSALMLLLGFAKPKKPTQTMMTITPEKPKEKPIAKPAEFIKPAPKTEPKMVYTEPKTTPPPPPLKTENPEPKIQPAKTAPVTTAEEKKTKTTNKQKSDTTENACPSCKKTFSQPLVMLDFEGGKSKLVNVCPYCNQVLGDTEQKNQ